MHLKLRDKQVNAPLHSSLIIKKTNNFTYVNTDNVKLHPNLDIAIVPVPQSKEKIILIKDVFQNPYEIRDLLSLSPIHKEPILGFPGYRSSLRYSFGELPTFVAYLLKEYYCFDATATFCHMNVIVPQEKVRKRSIVPHVDDMDFGYSIWLNTPDEIKRYPGTAFYKNKELNSCSLNCKNEEQYDEYLEKYYIPAADENEFCDFDSANIDKNVWETYFVSEMRFNSMILYPGSLFHQPYIKPHFFPECERISLSGVAK